MSLTPQFLDELRARTTLSLLIGRTVKIQRAGREWKACCPFHNEKTPSFTINDDKGFYHCFGCGAHGDAIRWMTDQRGLPFMDAVKELAAAAGMDVPAPDKRSAERAERAKGLYEVMADAADWFAQQLNGLAGAEARALLHKRGIKPETTRAFGMGYSPNARSALRTALKDYGDALLIEAGLLIQVEGRDPYDRFRGRLMIPIKDARGRVIAFGGRIIGEGEPKYLNSPDTPLFDKGRTLYNLDRAQSAARQTNRLIAVEGYMDVIALAQAGFDDVVAPLGTAMTEHQLEHMWRIVDVPALCFDGDTAGQKAALRAAYRALPVLTPGRSLSFVALPDRMDPDDVIADGGAPMFESLLSKSFALDDFLFRSELAVLSPNPNAHERIALKGRLQKLVEKFGHKDFAREYARAFDNKIFQFFGPKSKRFQSVGKAIAEAVRNPGRGLTYAFHRAVLLGLMRHTSVLRSEYEIVGNLPIEDRYLQQWQSHLLDLINEDDLDEDVVEEALSKTDISPIERRDMSRDLAYSFYHRTADRNVAETDLRQVMHILIDEAETRKAAALADEACKASISDETFERQQKAHREASAALDSLKEWLERLADAA